MRHLVRSMIAALSAGSLLTVSTVAAAQPRDLIGARAGQAENNLRARGYALDHSSGGVQYWWHAGNRECINLFVSNGRYDTIDRRPTSECNAGRGKKDNSGAIIAGALAIGILAAAAASKKHNDDDRDRRDDDRRDPPYSPARGVDCYPDQRSCYERGRGYSSYWTSREFNYRY